MPKIGKIFLVASSIFSASLFSGDLAASDREQQFHRGRGGFKGNERSERPGRFLHGQLNYGGSGCPAGTMRVVFAPDNLTFTVLFDKFVADSNTNQNGRRDRMGCDALLPFTLPNGQQMEITRVDYRGFASVPERARAMLHSVYNFVGPERGHGRWLDRDRINIRFNFQGPVVDNYELSTGAMNEGHGLNQTEISPCGGDAQLRIHNDLTVISPSGQQAILTIDSIDGSSNAVYYVNWKSCRAALAR